MGKKDSFSITKEDMEGGFKHAPGGTYFIRFTKDSKVTKNRKGDGNIAKLKVVITKGEHKGVSTFDNIAAHVGWKIGQILAALGIKSKMKGTLQELVKLVTNQECRATLKVTKYEGKKRNEVVQYLPLKATAAESAARDDDEDEDTEEDEELDEVMDTDDEEDDESDDDSEEEDDAEEDDDTDDEEEDDDEDEEDEDDSEDEEEEDEEEEAEDDDEDEDVEADDEDEDEEEEEEDEPAPRTRRVAKKSAAKKSAAAPAKKKKK